MLTAEQIKIAELNGVLDKLYSREIVNKIRLKYEVEDELAILRQRDVKPAEYAAYNEYVEQCKRETKAEFIAKGAKM